MGVVDSGRLSFGMSGQHGAVSWPTSKGFLPRTLIHGGARYRARLYRRGHSHVALAKVCEAMLEGAPADTPEVALANLLKLIDPEIENVRDMNGRLIV